MQPRKLKLGDRVRLAKRPECGEALVVAVNADGIPGGIRLDKPLGGTRTWYETDFEVFVGEPTHFNTHSMVEAITGRPAAAEPRRSVRERILESLRLDGAATCEEMVDRLGLRHQCVSGRFSELRKAGDIEPTSESRHTGTGAKAAVYRVNTAVQALRARAAIMRSNAKEGEYGPADFVKPGSIKPKGEDYPGKAADVKTALAGLRELL